MAAANPERRLIVPTSNQLAGLAQADWQETLSPFDLESAHVGGINVLLQPLEGVIVHINRRRAFYSDRQAREGTPPECSSENGVRGHGSVAAKFGGDCQACPMAEYGSAADYINEAPADSRAQACREFRLLYVLELGGERADPVLFWVPPTSLGEFKAFYRQVYGSGHRFGSIISRIELQPDKNANGVQFNRARFSILGDVPAELQPDIDAYAAGLAAIYP